jgi:hypothetical protein
MEKGASDSAALARVGKITHKREIMSYQDDLGRIKEKMLKADAALLNYFQSLTYGPKKEKHLVEADKAARDEYVAQLAKLRPV